MHILTRLVKFTPFKAGILVILAACLFFVLTEHKPELIEAVDQHSTDSMFRLRGAQATSGQVVILDIDERSLAILGQWPWPRNLIARLVERSNEAGAKVLGFDMVFAEADRSSARFSLEQLLELVPQAINIDQLENLRNNPKIDHDWQLGQALMQTTAVLGYIFQFREDGLKDPATVPFPSLIVRTVPGGIPYDRLDLTPAYRATVNIPAIAIAQSEGFFNFLPDPSGIIRKVPLLMQLDGIPYPALTLEMVRIGLQQTEVILHLAQLDRGGKRGLLGVQIGQRRIATDDRSQMTLNHRGPTDTFPYLSAIDILEGRHLEQLRDKYVLFGATAAGLHDFRATPFAANLPGVEVHATVIDNLLVGDPMTHDPVTERGLTLVLLLAGGILLALLLGYSGPLIGGLAGGLLLLATLAGNYYVFFLNNQIIGLTFPLLTLLAVFLVVSISNYFHEGRQRRFLNRAFGHYVSPQVVDQLVKNPQQLTLVGEERELSIMFSDIRGFTSLSEQMTPEQLGRFMNRYLTAMSKIILREKGTVDKFIGDAIMALWNAPLADPDHAVRSVRVALAMIEELESLGQEWQAEGLPPINIGIGINTGTVSVGNFGSEERFDYTVIGDHVNLASRLEGLSKTYGVPIIISQFTRDAIGRNFTCRLLDRVRVKGKEQPLEIYQPLGEAITDTAILDETERFARALGNYFQGDFVTAEHLIGELSAQHPEPIYRLYLDRIAAFRQSPPPLNWDGVTTMTSK